MLMRAGWILKINFQNVYKFLGVLDKAWGYHYNSLSLVKWLVSGHMKALRHELS